MILRKKNEVMNILERLDYLPEKIRYLISLTLDFLVFLLSLYISLKIYKLEFINFSETIYFSFITALISILTYQFFGIYKSLARYIGRIYIYRILQLNVLISIFLFIYFALFKSYFSILFILTFWYITSGLLIFTRFLMKDFLLSYKNKKFVKKKIIIYGAGVAGGQLLEALNYSRKYNVRYFVDDNKKLWGRIINGVRVISPKDISTVSNEFEKILIALPDVNSERYRSILVSLESYGKEVLQIPAIQFLKTGELPIDSLRPIEMEDLIKRRQLDLNEKIIKDEITNKSICITGAGGSIGKELVKQVLNYFPSNIYLIDSSENNLYKLIQELDSLNIKSIDISFHLLNCLDKGPLNKLFETRKIDIIFHAAAYKHVPIVEDNPFSGIKNNIISTKNICDLSIKNKVEKVILISTDKAVRPTNIMGTTKRVSEIIMQLYDKKVKNSENNLKTIFSIVRFGNVLNSSGSVVPLFNKQIRSGGPITLTHPDIVRFFMTIPEATKLVIQASVMAFGGDVFILDMGEPQKIYDLAKNMIKLSGFTLKDKDNPKGDIEIVTTGLRPGEKLYEELLINGESIPTIHPLIFKSNEDISSIKEKWQYLIFLEKAISNIDELQALRYLEKLVPEWKKSVN